MPPYIPSRRSKKYPPDLRQRAWDMRVAGTAIPKIAAILGLSVATVRYFCVGARVTKQQFVKNTREARAISEEQLQRLLDLRASGVPIAEVARQVGCSCSCVKRNTRSNGVVVDRVRAYRNITEGRRISRLAALGVENFDEWFQKVAAEKGGEMLSAYENARTKVKWRCAKGHVFMMAPHSVTLGRWCRSCSIRAVSRPQAEVEKFVRALGISVFSENRKMISPMELDVWCPDQSLGIEYNGLLYHSDYHGDQKHRHLRKALMCRAQGIRLLSFYQDEWADPTKRELVKDAIQRRLGFLPQVQAQGLELVRLEYGPEVKEFFAASHLDGDLPAEFAWGLRHEGRLVFCASFRRSVPEELEVVRVACLPRLEVAGALGRMLGQVAGPLVCYSNNRFGHGRLLQSLGFTEVEEVPPLVWYTDGFLRAWPWQCPVVRDLALLEKWQTQAEQARAGLFSRQLFGHDKPLYQIEDYGHRKWVRLQNLR